MGTRERACLLDLGWLLVVDHESGRTRLLPPTVAFTWARTSSVPTVERVGWPPSLSTHEVPLEGEPPPRARGRALVTAALGMALMVIAANVGARSGSNAPQGAFTERVLIVLESLGRRTWLTSPRSSESACSPWPRVSKHYYEHMKSGLLKEPAPKCLPDISHCWVTIQDLHTREIL